MSPKVFIPKYCATILFLFSTHPYLKAQKIERKAFEDDTFIVNLVNQKGFSKCSLLVFQDKFRSDYSVDRILENAVFRIPFQRTAYSIKYSFLSTNFLTQSASNKNGTSNVPTPPSNPTSSLKFSNKISYHRKLSNPCLISILMVNDLRSEFINEIYKILTPPYMPITRKDEDFYIFKTEPKHHKRLLLMKELPKRIKFKIAVGCEATNTEVRVKVRTICFFCRDGGKPRLLTFSVTKQNLPVPDKDYFPDFVWDLNGKLLRVSVPAIKSKVELDPPWKVVGNSKRGHYKFFFEDYLMVKFNFTYYMFLATGLEGGKGRGGTGRILPNGTWIGVTGDLISGKAHIGFSTANTPSRIQYIGFTDSFYDTGCLTFVTAQPKRIFSALAFLWSFDLAVWTGIGLSVLLSIIFFFIFFKIIRMSNIETENRWSIIVQIQFLLATFLEQDVPILPKSQALRWFVALWVLFTMILTNAYRSKMVELLAFPIMDKLPQTFEELAFSHYQVGFMKHGDSAYNTLAASTDPVYKKLVAEMEIITGEGLECLQKVFQLRYACIAYDTSLVILRAQNLSETDTRRLVFAPATTYMIYMGLAFEARSIYLLNFGKVISYTRPFFLRDMWETIDLYYNVRLPKLEWWERTGQTDKTKHAEDPSDDLTLKHISGAFYVLFAALLTSSFVFLVEKMSNRNLSRIY